MINIRRTVMSMIVLALLAACNSTAGSPPNPQPSAYAPQPGDGSMMEGEIRVDSASIRLAESYPPQVFLDLAYFQPTPCYKLRLEVLPPDAQNRIVIHGYAVAEKDKPCTLMALTTPLHASLSLGSYPKGHYVVWLNGSQIGEFDS
jgi:hypothetical protein